MAVVEARAAWRRSAQESTLTEPHHSSGHERSPSTRSERAGVSVDSARRQACAKYPTLRRVFVGSAHARTCAARLEATHDVTVHVVRHSGGGRTIVVVRTTDEGIAALPKSWIVERSHAWLWSAHGASGDAPRSSGVGLRELGLALRSQKAAQGTKRGVIRQHSLWSAPVTYASCAN